MSDHPERDRIYARPMEQIVDFRFDEQVANVFPDMLKRSVPGYSTMIALTGILAARYAQANSSLYDLGCSLGASTLAMRHRVHAENCKLISVDTSAPMLERCRAVLDQEDSPLPVELIEQDIRETPIHCASVVVLNLTLQFLPPADRSTLLQRIHSGMLPGGVLILTEKIDAGPDSVLPELHTAFKLANGYSDLEISQKRSALENVMIPEALDTHRDRIEQAGFTGFEVCFQCLNFASMIAFR